MKIELRNLTKRFGRMVALSIPQLTIDPGQIVVVLGANGAGKTTLFRCLSSLVIPSDGEILYDGVPLRRGDIALRRRVMFLPDFPFAYAEMSIIRHLAMVLRLYEIEPESRIANAVEHLRHFDLLPLAETPMRKLSRGQLYKATLATLLTVDPELWILDEPFASGMDPQGIYYFKEQVRAAADRGRTILYSTQLLDVAEKLADRICVLNRGTLEVNDTVAALRAGSGTTSVLEELIRSFREQ